MLRRVFVKCADKISAFFSSKFKSLEAPENERFFIEIDIPYMLFAGILILFEVGFISKGLWYGDFWEHSAVINELSRNTLHPQNPILESNISHSFYSPYSIMLAEISKGLHISPVHTLEYFGYCNLLFFLFSYYIFCISIFGNKNKRVAVISLILILFFWGRDPWNWSGFYHIIMLNYALPYPSSFSMSLSLLILSIVSKDSGRLLSVKHIFVILLSLIVFLTHPTTGLFLFAGIAALNITYHNFTTKQAFIKTVFTTTAVLTLSFLWPYYSVFNLITGHSSFGYHNVSKVLYNGLFSKNWPVLLALPAFVIIKNDKTLGFLCLSGSFMVVVLTAGKILGLDMVARLISCVVMTAHFLTAYFLVILIRRKSNFKMIYVPVLISAIFFSVYKNRDALGKTLSMQALVEDYDEKYNFLRTKVSARDLILSDSINNWFIPAFNGKVVSTKGPLYGVNDLQLRNNEVRAFFSNKNNDSLRQVLLLKYHPDYILLDRDKDSLGLKTLQWINSLGDLVFKNENFVLIKLQKFHR